jgi:hypothetical protein
MGEFVFCVLVLPLPFYLQDQFINHIINETGASVVLRGCDSGNSSSHAEGMNYL